MTTLPPEANNEQNPADGQVPPQAPPYQPPLGNPQAAPEQPPAGGYQQPPAGGYQPPPAGAYQQPPQGYPQQPGYAPQGAPTDPANTITLNYWLSVFFTWIPALIFYIIEKDKGDQRANAFHVANLNFSLLRTGLAIVAVILGLIPFIGWILGLIVWLAYLASFVFHIIAAVSAPDNYRQGKEPGFIFNLPIIK